MRRIALVLFMAGSVLLSSRSVMALGTAQNPRQSVPPLRHLAVHGHAVKAHDLIAVPRQVQSGAIKDPNQLKEPVSVYPSEYQNVVAGATFTAKDADDTGYATRDTGLFFAVLHNADQPGSVHFSYKEVGMLFGYAEVAKRTFSDGINHYLEYLASAYTSPDAAVGALNSLVNYFNAYPNAQPTTCSFPGADQCLNVNITDAVTVPYPSKGQIPYTAVLRILQKSNSVWEGGFFLPTADVNLNRDFTPQALDSMANGYVALFSGSPGPGSGPTPGPTNAPPPPKATPTLAFRPPSQPTATPTSVPVQFSVVKVQFQKPTSSPKASDRALKKVKPRTKLILVVFFDVQSGPPDFPYTAAFTIKRGGRIVAHSKDDATLDSSDPTGRYSFRAPWTPKTVGTYKGTYAISMNGRTQQRTATIKVANA